jgi:hypothetical protein
MLSVDLSKMAKSEWLLLPDGSNSLLNKSFKRSVPPKYTHHSLIGKISTKNQIMSY